MGGTNIKEIQESFTIQAGNFNDASMNFSKEEYLAYTVSEATISKTDRILEVAAGTCACGRAMAPYAASVTCLDVTPAMLESGKMEADKMHIYNRVFVKGGAGSLPFVVGGFEIVISRLAFHHFKDVQKPFSEMKRVLRPGGKLILIDMEAAQEELRGREDEIETWRDPSHVRNLSREEIRELFLKNALDVVKCESTKIPVNLQAWMNLTKTADTMQEKITECMMDEIAGKDKTGFMPYQKDGEIYFDQRWLLTIGKK